jgi:hypothetical protein
MERMYPRLRAHPWLGDLALALLLLGGSASAYAGQPALIPVSAALAGAVAVRRRFPVAALAAGLPRQNVTPTPRSPPPPNGPG